MEVTGRIKVIGITQEFGSNGFKKRELVITTEEQYPQSIMVEFVQDKCVILDAYQVGALVKIGINLRGREWVNPQGETKYFNSIQGWRIENVGANEKVGSAVDAHKANGPVADATAEDDLPFW